MYACMYVWSAVTFDDWAGNVSVCVCTCMYVCMYGGFGALSLVKIGQVMCTCMFVCM